MSAAIFGMWRNWAIAVGFLAILCFVSPLVDKAWVAPLCLLSFFVLKAIQHILAERDVPNCSRMFQETGTILLIITVLLAGIYFWVRKGVSFEITGRPITDKVPFLSILLAAPVSAVVALCFLLQKKEPLVCQLCHMRYGNVVERGFIGDLYRREWRYQTKLLLIACVALSAIDWTYYLVHYVNVNLNRADHFFFLWMPLVLYVLSLVYLGIRYYSLWVFYCQNDERHLVENPSSTTVRFIVICDDKILLDICPTEGRFANGAVIKRFDTPASFTLPYQERFDIARAREMFVGRTGIRNVEIRPIYSSPDNVTFRNIFHYFAFIDSFDDAVDSGIQGEWFTIGELRQLIAQHLVGRGLNSELSRIYRVAMAWKTYDREGKRLYRIKHYRPTFRLKDIRSWDVDYNDGHWLSIGRYNEDNRFYHLYRFLNKLASKFRRSRHSDNMFAL